MHNRRWLPSCRSSWRSTLKEIYLGIEVSATDGSGQTVTSSKAIRVYNAPLIYSLDSGHWMQRPKQNFDVVASVVDLQGQPVADREVQLAVLGFSNGWEKREVSKLTGKTGPDGKLVLPLHIDEEGYYELTLSDPKYLGSDSFVINDWVYISGSARTWSQTDYGDFAINAERNSYKPYEKAKLMITSPFDGPALLTFIGPRSSYR